MDRLYTLTSNEQGGYTIRGEKNGKQLISFETDAGSDSLDLHRAVELIRNARHCRGSQSVTIVSTRLTAKSIPALILLPSQSQSLPFVIFLHGFSSSKEKTIRHALKIAAEGYAVILPDLPRHGERFEHHFGDSYDLRKNTAEAVCNRLHIAVEAKDELSLILDEAEKDPRFDISRCALAGISMGGTAALVCAAGDRRVKAVLPFVSVQYFAGMSKASESDLSLIEKDPAVRDFDPVKAIKGKIPAAILLQTGAADREVPKECGRTLDSILSSSYQGGDGYRFIEHEDAGHEVTQEMLHEAIRWLNEKL